MLVAHIAEQPRKFAFMRRQHHLRVVRGLDRFEQMFGRFGKARQRVGIQHEMALGRQRGQDQIARPLADAGARPDHAGVEPLVTQQLGKLDHGIDGAHHHRGQALRH